jgi:serine protease Do
VLGPVVLAGLLAGLGVSEAPALVGQQVSLAQAEPARPPSKVARPRATSLVELAERTRAAVVHVRGTLEGGPRKDDKARGRGTPPSFSVGSGFLIEPAGSIVTNEHVVRGATDLRVRLDDGREFSACVVGLDEQADIALLRITTGKLTLPVLEMGDSDKVHAGENVIAVGSPFGFAHSVTAGIVSANERVVEQESGRGDDAGPPYAFYIQTDASINVGNSGGPLVDHSGLVIGVNAAFWGGTQPSSGVGFAIPINIVKLLLPQLKNGGAPRSMLGLWSQAISPALARGLALPSTRGALVAGIDRGSAAEAAGIEIGDVVTRFGAHQLATGADFRIFAQLTAPGTEVKVGLWRDGRAIEKVLLTRAADKSTHSTHAEDCRNRTTAAPTSIGFEVQALPAARAAQVPGKYGVQVSRVSGWAARDANVEVGDIIQRVGRRPVSSPEEFKQQIDAWKREAPLPLLVRTRNRSFWTALSPGP